MARIAGVDLPREKKSWNRAYLYLWYRKNKFKQNFESAGVNPDIRVKRFIRRRC